MGLHPCHVKEDFKAELAVLKKHLDAGGFCAIGEIGMDLYWDKTFVEEQKDAFRTQIHWAKENGLPIAIHCRDAFDEIFEILEDEKDDYSVAFFIALLEHSNKPTEPLILIFIWALVVWLPLKSRDWLRW